MKAGQKKYVRSVRGGACHETSELEVSDIGGYEQIIIAEFNQACDLFLEKREKDYHKRKFHYGRNKKKGGGM